MIYWSATTIFQLGLGGNFMAQLKVIKRYRNRKLYNAKCSAYITLDDLRSMLREGMI